MFRRDLAEITGLAATDIGVLIASVSSIRELRELLEETLPGLVGLYGQAAAALAADWYDEVREAEGARGRFFAIAAELPDAGRTSSLAGWATAQAVGNARVSVSSFDVDREVVAVKVAGGLQRVVADAARGTIMGSSIADPQAAGWQRVGSGECGFCTLLIRRGAVYSERSATFASHDHCQCAAVPSFGGDRINVDEYVPTTRNISDADRARTREYLRAQGLTA